jgi:hypothetical protein
MPSSHDDDGTEGCLLILVNLLLGVHAGDERRCVAGTPAGVLHVTILDVPATEEVRRGGHRNSWGAQRLETY